MIACSTAGSIAIASEYHAQMSRPITGVRMHTVDGIIR